MEPDVGPNATAGCVQCFALAGKMLQAERTWLRTIEVQRFVGAIGVAPEGIHFESLDHEPTKIVFLTLSPLTSRRKHLNLLSRLVCFMRDKVMNMQMNHPIKPHEIYQYLRDLDYQSGLAG